MKVRRENRRGGKLQNPLLFSSVHSKITVDEAAAVIVDTYSTISTGRKRETPPEADDSSARELSVPAGRM